MCVENTEAATEGSLSCCKDSSAFLQSDAEVCRFYLSGLLMPLLT